MTSAPDSSLRATPFRMTVGGSIQNDNGQRTFDLGGERLTLPIALFHNGCLFGTSPNPLRPENYRQVGG